MENSGLKNGSRFMMAVTTPKHIAAFFNCLAASSESAAGALTLNYIGGGQATGIIDLSASRVGLGISLRCN